MQVFKDRLTDILKAFPELEKFMTAFGLEGGE
jgi:hypothetical protein